MISLVASKIVGLEGSPEQMSGQQMQESHDMKVTNIAVENWQSSNTVGRHLPPYQNCMHFEIKSRLNR